MNKCKARYDDLDLRSCTIKILKEYFLYYTPWCISTLPLKKTYFFVFLPFKKTTFSIFGNIVSNEQPFQSHYISWNPIYKGLEFAKVVSSKKSLTNGLNKHNYNNIIVNKIIAPFDQPVTN